MIKERQDTHLATLTEARRLLDSKRKEPIINFILNNNYTYTNQHNTFVSVYSYDLTLKQLKESLLRLLNSIVDMICKSDVEDELINVEVNTPLKEETITLVMIDNLGLDYDTERDDNG